MEMLLWSGEIFISKTLDHVVIVLPCVACNAVCGVDGDEEISPEGKQDISFNNGSL